MPSEPSTVLPTEPTGSPLKPIHAGGGLPPSHPGRTPVLRGSGSAQAADGSAITWTTAPDGAVTAIGSAGRQMVLRLAQQGQSVAVKSAFSAPGRGTYLTAASAANFSGRTMSVQIAAGASKITFATTLAGATTRTAIASGNIGSTPVYWSGQVDLTSPASALAGVPGLDSAFSSQLAEASSSAPALRVLAGDPGSGKATASLKPAFSPQDSPSGPDVGKALIGGLAKALAGSLESGVKAGLFGFVQGFVVTVLVESLARLPTATGNSGGVAGGDGGGGGSSSSSSSSSSGGTD